MSSPTPKTRKKRKVAPGLFNLAHIARVLNLTPTEKQYLFRSVYSNAISPLSEPQFRKLDKHIREATQKLLNQLNPLVRDQRK